MILRGRGISKGVGEGEIVLDQSPVSFLGGVDPATGRLNIPSGDGASIKSRVFAFPRGKGSTVGSYVLLEMRRQGTLPAALINASTEPIVATGAVMAGVPLVDRIDLSLLRTGDRAVVDGNEGTVELPEVREVHVVSCVVQHGEELLLLKRSEKVGTFQGYWAAVSGYVEEGESSSEAACKELREETGMELPIAREGVPLTVRDGDNIWHIHPYLFLAGDRQVIIDWEHTEHCWVRPEEMKGFQTVPGLVEIVRDLL
ncbi:MAG: DUF126 domain-containing protein [Methanomassiliicoccus sp.]|nr:DUF126 domain-containing protein [Methanomassiliicoccus sp.]